MGNHDALELLFRTMRHAKQYEVSYSQCSVSACDGSFFQVKMQALRCVQDIVAVNSINLVDVHHVGGTSCLLRLLYDMCVAGDEVSQHRVRCSHVNLYI